MNISDEINSIFDDLLDLINHLLQINLDKYFENNIENKFDIVIEILIFVLEVLSGEISLKINKNKTIDENYLKKSLVSFIETKYNDTIDSVSKKVFNIFKKEKNVVIIIIGTINKVKDFTEEKFRAIKNNYQVILKMIKTYNKFIKQKCSDFIINLFLEIEGIKNFFEYLVEYFGNRQLYELQLQKQVDHINEFKNAMIEKINKAKNDNLNEICKNCENELKNVYEKYVEKNMFGIIKKGKELMNNTVKKGEDTIFGGLNSIIMTEDYKNKSYNSEFDRFKDGAINSIDNKICSEAKGVEEQLMNYVGNLDQYAQDYLQMKFPDIIDKNLFNLIKAKKENSLGYNIFNKKFLVFGESKLDTCLDKFRKSDIINKTTQTLENNVLNEIRRISDLLEPLNKDNFKKNIKNKIKDKILNIYENKIEPEFEAFIKDICNKIISKLCDKIKDAM